MKKWQNGRSMLEMLAVLALIAILSVAGLAGYVTAMNRYRANQILEYVNRCALIAQSHGDGYKMDNAICGNLLSDSAPNGLDGQEFFVNVINDFSFTVTTPYIASKDLRNGLVARATTRLNGEIIDIWDLQGKIEFTFQK